MINEAIGLSGVYDELGIPMTIVLQLDSTAAIGMIQRRGTGRARHMDLRHLFLQERLRDGTIGAIEKIDTSVNLADVGTKHFTASRLEELKRLLGMVDVVDESVLHATEAVGSVFCCRCGSTGVSGRFWRNQQRYGSSFEKN